MAFKDYLREQEKKQQGNTLQAASQPAKQASGSGSGSSLLRQLALAAVSVARDPLGTIASATKSMAQAGSQLAANAKGQTGTQAAAQFRQLSPTLSAIDNAAAQKATQQQAVSSAARASAALSLKQASQAVEAATLRGTRAAANAGKGQFEQTARNSLAPYSGMLGSGATRAMERGGLTQGARQLIGLEQRVNGGQAQPWRTRLLDAADAAVAQRGRELAQYADSDAYAAAQRAEADRLRDFMGPMVKDGKVVDTGAAADAAMKRYYEELPYTRDFRTATVGNSMLGQNTQAMMKEFAGRGNVDLFKRPKVSASRMKGFGWGDGGDGIATLYSSTYSAGDRNQGYDFDYGENVVINATPIRDDGYVMSPAILERYIEKLARSGNILEADKPENGGHGLIISVDKVKGSLDEAYEKAGQEMERLHEMQEIFYEGEPTPVETELMDYMTADERRTYDYIMMREGRQAALDYLNSMRSELGRRMLEQTAKKRYELGQKDPWLAGVARTVDNVVGNIEAGGYVAKKTLDAAGAGLQNIFENGQNYFANRGENVVTAGNSGTMGDFLQPFRNNLDIDPNSRWFSAQVARDYTDKGITSNMSPIGSFLYQSAMSGGVDSMLNSVLFGGAGIGMMGMGVMAGGVKDVLDRGGTQEQALLMGTVEGLAEIITENMGSEAMAKKLINGTPNVVKTILRGMLGESIEEGTSEIIDFLADNLVMADKSELNRRVEELVNSGMSRTDADKAAIKEEILKIGESMAGGAVGALFMGGMGGAARAFDRTAQTVATRDIEKLAKDYKGKAADVFINAWDGQTPPTEYKAAFDALWKSGQTGIGLEETQKAGSEVVGKLSPGQQYGIWQAGANEAANTQQEAESEVVDPISGERIAEAPAAQASQAQATQAEAIETPQAEDVALEATEEQAETIPTPNATLGQRQQSADADSSHFRGAQAEIAAMPDVSGRTDAERFNANKLHSGVVKNYKTQDLTDAQKWSIIEWDRIGKAFGYEIEFRDTVADGNAYGMFQGGRRVILGLDNQTQAYHQVGWHETGHFMEENDPEGYAVVKKMVFDYLAEDEAWNLDKEIQRRMEVYAKGGQNLTRTQIENEIVNETLGTAMGTRKFVERFAQSDAGLLKRIQKWWHEVMQKIMDIIQGTTIDYMNAEDRTEIAIMQTRTKEQLERLSDTIESALRRASENAAAREAARTNAETALTNAETALGNTGTALTGEQEEMPAAASRKGEQIAEGVVRYSAKQDEDDETFIRNQVNKAQDISSDPKEVKKNFEAWFRNSQIVNEDGSPKVMYHGTASDFWAFDMRKSNDKTGRMMGLGAGKGKIYLTEHEASARLAASGAAARGGKNERVLGLYVSAQKVMDRADYNAQLEEAYKKYPNSRPGTPGYNYEQRDRAIAAVDKQVKAEGYDAVWDRDSGELFVYSPTQVKSATANIGTYDRKNQDIRFSMKAPVGDQPGVRFALKNTSKEPVETDKVLGGIGGRPAIQVLNDTTVSEKEAAEAKQREAAQRQAMTQNEVEYATALKKAADYAPRILREYQSEYNKDMLRDNLKGLMNELAQNGRSQTTMDETAKLARAIIEKSKHVDNSMREQYKDLLKEIRETHVKLTETQKQEAANIAGNYNAFRMSVFGTFNLTNEGKSLDAIWDEWSTKAPELFTPGMNEGDMVQRLADIKGQMMPKVSNPYGEDMDGAATDLAMQIHEKLLGMLGDREGAKVMRDAVRDLRRQYQEAMQDELLRIRSKRRYAFDQIASSLRQANRTKNPEAAEASMRAYRAQMQRIGAEEAEAQARIAYRIQYEDHAARAAAVKRITQNREALMKMLAKPDKKKHIPIELQGPVLEVLNGIDITRDGKATEGSEMWKQSLKKIGDMLARQMDRQEHGGDTQGVWMTIRPEMVESFQEAADVVARSRKPMGQMTLNEIMNLSQALATVRHCINSANELFANSRYKDINDLAGQSISEMKKLKTNAAQGIEGLDTADRLLNVDSLDAGSFMERLGSAATSVFDELHEGMDRGFSVARQASEDIPKILGLEGKDKKKREKELNAWANDKRKITLHRGAQEAEVTVTTRNLMELYAWARREQTRMHLLSGGWQPKPKKIGKLQAMREKMQGEKLAELLNDTPVYQMSEDDLKRLVGDYEHETGTESENTGMLTLEQKKMTRAMQDYLSGPMAQLGNEVSMKMWDFMMFNEPNYWPGKTASEFRNTKEQDGTVLFNAQTNKGFTKQTQEVAKNPLVLGDAIDTFLGHIGDMANFYGYAMPVDDLLKWYNYSERNENGSLTWDGNMKKEIKRIAGQPGIEFIQHLLDDLNGGMNRGNFSSALEKIVGKAGSRYKSSSIAAKFRVAVQQPTAVARAAAFMDRRDVLAASAKMAANYATMGKFAKNKIKEMQAHSPLAWWKAQGNYEIGTGASMYTILTGMHRTGREAFNERLMWLAGRMDDLGWLTIWEASEMEVKRKNKGIQVGSEEYFDKVRERFEDVCMKTQVVDTILTRTESMRNRNPLVKNLTAFQSEPLKNYNLLRNGISELRRAKQTGDQAAMKQAGKRIRRSVEAIVVSQALNAVVTALYDTIKWRDPDKDEDTFLEQFWKRFWGDYEGLTTGQAIGKALIGKGGDFLQNINPLAWITFVKDIVSVIGGDDVDRTELSAPARLVKDVQNLFGYLGDNKKGYTAWGAIKPFLKDMSQATGSPVSGLIDDTEIILNAISLATGGKVGSMKTRERAATMAGAVEELYEAVTAGDTAKAARLRANMEKGQFGQDPMSPKDIDTKLAKMLAREDERVAQAWEAAQDIDGGSAKTRLRNDLMKDGWSKETADYAIDHYDEIMTGDAKAALKQAKADGDEDAAEAWRDVLRGFGWDEEKIAKAEAEKDLEEALESPKATVKELYQMIRAGEAAEASAIRGRLIAEGKSKEDVSKGLADMLATYDQRIETLWQKRNTGHALKAADYQAIQKDGFTDEEVKRAVNQYPNIVKSEVKALYLQAMADGDAKAAASYRQRLLDVGTKEETIDGWAVGKDLDAELEEQKMYTNANLWASIRGDDTTDADILDIRDYMLSQSKAADPEASLRSSMTSEFKDEYVDLMVSGRTREAERLKQRLVLAGAKEETINGWVQSAKKDEYIELVNAGKTQEAEKLRSAMISAGGKADTIDNWVPAAQKKEATDALKAAIEKRDSRAAEAEIERILDEELMDKSAIVSSLNSKFKQQYFDLLDAGREREADELADMLAGLGLRKKNGDNYYAGSWWNEQYRDYLKKKEEDE